MWAPSGACSCPLRSRSLFAHEREQKRTLGWIFGASGVPQYAQWVFRVAVRLIASAHSYPHVFCPLYFGRNCLPQIGQILSAMRPGHAYQHACEQKLPDTFPFGAKLVPHWRHVRTPRLHGSEQYFCLALRGLNTVPHVTQDFSRKVASNGIASSIRTVVITMSSYHIAATK